MRQLIILASLCAGLLWATPAKAGIFWDDSFETALSTSSTGPWRVGSCIGGGYPLWPDGCNPVRSTQLSHTGSYSLRGDYSGLCGKPAGVIIGRSCGAFYDRDISLSSPKREIYVRFWYRTTGFVYDPTQTKHFYLAGVHGQYPDFVIGHNPNREMTMGSETQVALPGSPCSAASIATGFGGCRHEPNQTHVPMSDGVWYCVQIHAKYNTPGVANGAFEMWVNGAKTHNYQGQTYVPVSSFSASGGTLSRDAVLNRLRLYVQAGGGILDPITKQTLPGTGFMYYDDFAVGDSSISCGSGVVPPVVDTTSPSQPTALTVN